VDSQKMKLRISTNPPGKKQTENKGSVQGRQYRWRQSERAIGPRR
jgi:hypothetical protein